MNRFLTGIAALAVCAFTFTASAAAEKVNWSLNGTHTDGGGNLGTDCFAYDADSGAFSNQALQFGTALCTVTSVANNTVTRTAGTLKETLAPNGAVTDAGGVCRQGKRLFPG